MTPVSISFETVLLVLLIGTVLIAVALLIVAVRRQTQIQTDMGKQSTDASMAGKLAVYETRLASLEEERTALKTEVTELKSRIVTLEIERIQKLESLNSILQEHIMTLQTEIGGLKATIAEIKTRLGPEEAAKILAVPETPPPSSIPPKPTPKAPVEGAKT